MYTDRELIDQYIEYLNQDTERFFIHLENIKDKVDLVKLKQVGKIFGEVGPISSLNIYPLLKSVGVGHSSSFSDSVRSAVLNVLNEDVTRYSMCKAFSHTGLLYIAYSEISDVLHSEELNDDINKFTLLQGRNVDFAKVELMSSTEVKKVFNTERLFHVELFTDKEIAFKEAKKWILEKQRERELSYYYPREGCLVWRC